MFGPKAPIKTGLIHRPERLPPKQSKISIPARRAIYSQISSVHDLAFNTSTAPLNAAPGKYLSIHVGPELYGIPVLRIREIIRLPKIRPIPEMPARSITKPILSIASALSAGAGQTASAAGQVSAASQSRTWETSDPRPMVELVSVPKRFRPVVSLRVRKTAGPHFAPPPRILISSTHRPRREPMRHFLGMPTAIPDQLIPAPSP